MGRYLVGFQLRDSPDRLVLRIRRRIRPKLAMRVIRIIHVQTQERKVALWVPAMPH
jgi:hypothetical protein